MTQAMPRETSAQPQLRDPSLLAERAYVAGEWIVSEKTFDVTDPFDGSVIASVPDLTAGHARQAIDKAAAVQKEWAARSPKDRAAILKAWFALINENVEDLAIILSMEQGKPLAEARTEIVANAAYIEWFAEEAKRVQGDVIPADVPGRRNIVLKQPVGVCAAITPWNFPNGMITRKAGPALAAGCALVLKPAAQTPLSALALAVLAERSGVPKGLFSVVTTADARSFGMEVCKNPKVAKITFTGSTGVGQWLMREGADTIKRLSLELGGNAPFIVFDDADLDAAADGAITSKFRNSGQTCVCANRLYVHESVAEAFTQKLLERVAKLRLGRGASAPELMEAYVGDRIAQLGGN